MPKMKLKCDFCGKKYQSYQCGKHVHFCSIECRRKGAYMLNEYIPKKEQERRTKQIILVNKTINNSAEKIEKGRIAKSKKGEGKSYKKYYGRHEHRVVAEQKIGRKLRKGEIVHHIDGNKRNNNPDNLEIMTQSEHMKEHLRRGGGRLCSNYIDTKN